LKPRIQNGHVAVYAGHVQLSPDCDILCISLGVSELVSGSWVPVVVNPVQIVEYECCSWSGLAAGQGWPTTNAEYLGFTLAKLGSGAGSSQSWIWRLTIGYVNDFPGAYVSKAGDFILDYSGETPPLDLALWQNALAQFIADNPGTPGPSNFRIDSISGSTKPCVAPPPSGPPPAGACPTTCGSCCSRYAMTVAGAGPTTDSWVRLNVGICSWSTDTGGTFYSGASISCVPAAGDTPAQWRAVAPTIYGDVAFWAPISGPCPPTTGWTPLGDNPAGTSGATLTLSCPSSATCDCSSCAGQSDAPEGDTGYTLGFNTNSSVIDEDSATSLVPAPEISGDPCVYSNTEGGGDSLVVTVACSGGVWTMTVTDDLGDVVCEVISTVTGACPVGTYNTVTTDVFGGPYYGSITVEP
jgi:hypothetical protein